MTTLVWELECDANGVKRQIITANFVQKHFTFPFFTIPVRPIGRWWLVHADHGGTKRRIPVPPPPPRRIPNTNNASLQLMIIFTRIVFVKIDVEETEKAKNKLPGRLVVVASLDVTAAVSRQ